MGRAIILSLALLIFMGGDTVALQIKKKDLIGTWKYIESYLILPDGRRVDQFSQHPQGLFILLPNGWYSHIIMRDDLPRISSGTNFDYTPEEAMEIAKGGLAHFGNYTVDEKNGEFTAEIISADFPNLNRQKQKRTVVELTKTTLRYINDTTNAGPGARVHATLERIK